MLENFFIFLNMKQTFKWANVLDQVENLEGGLNIFFQNLYQIIKSS